MTMKTEQVSAKAQAKPDLSKQYRPLAIKAVLAAALMAKAPKKKLA